MATVAAVPEALGGAVLSGATRLAWRALPCTCIYLDRSGGTEGAITVQRVICPLLPRSPAFGLFLMSLALAQMWALWATQHEWKFSKILRRVPRSAAT